MKPAHIGIALILIGLVLAVSFLATKMNGPKKFSVPLGQLTAEIPQFRNVSVKSPNPHAWFVGIVAVVENGVLENEQDLAVIVRKGGEDIFSKRFLASELLKGNPVTRNSFLLVLDKMKTAVSARDALGYGVEFQVSAVIYNPKTPRLQLYAQFLDDRLFKIK